MITRELTQQVRQREKRGLVNVVYGPRRVGKTTLIKQLTANQKELVWYNGDTQEAQEQLATNSETRLTELVGRARVVVVDEAQRIEGIGLALKIMVDKFPEKTYYVSGSSSLWLARGTKEALTGRQQVYRLYPLSCREELGGVERASWQYHLSRQLTWGGYPELTTMTSAGDKRVYLEGIVESYLFRDVRDLTNIYQPELLRKLATLLAYQVGNEISYNELATQLQSDVKTVAKYLSLLEQSFVIIKLASLTRNLRGELKDKKKYYFWDLGVRNALIGQFGNWETRVDKGALWENYLAIERMKMIEYRRLPNRPFFWRNYNKAEIDWVEERDGRVEAWEFKWRKGRATQPMSFVKAYGAKVKVISQDNYGEWLG